MHNPKIRLVEKIYLENTEVVDDFKILVDDLKLKFIPRVGEKVAYNAKIYVVESITHNIDCEFVDIYVKEK